MSSLGTIWKFSWPYLRRYWGRLLAGVLLGILFGLSNTSFVWATKTVFERMDPEAKTFSLPTKSSAIAGRLATLNEKVNRAIDPWLPSRGRKLDWQQILGGIMLLPGLIFIRGMLSYFSTYFMCWVSERVLNDLRVSVLDKLHSLSLDFFNRSSTGDLLTRVNMDTASLHRCMLLGFTDLVKEPVTVLFVIISLCLVSWKLTLVAFLFIPLCIIPVQILGKKARKATKATVNAGILQSSLLIEIISGIRVVKSFGLERHQLERFRALSHQMIHHAMKWVQARELVNPLVETFAMLGLGALIVYIVSTNTSVPELVGFLTGVVICFTPIKKLANLHVMFQQTSVGVERLDQLFGEQPTVKEPPTPRALPAFSKALEFHQTSFGYGQKTVLEDLNLVLPRGFRLGVAGESGSGKSTLVNLIFRFYDPNHGSITFDGIDLRDVGISDLRSQMALVSQEIVLFDLTVAENIACGKAGATRQEIEAAAKAANAHDFIMQLEHGYDSRIGERGVTLSGGQRQRLCIARAFVRDAPILVLDEATASLDSQSEAEVQAAIDRLAENRTVVSVAHRLSTLANMDQIIVMSQGRVVEKGTFDELLQRNGLFAAMARAQGLTARNTAA